ncbi:DUF1150 family protein [Notoacmeibacter ruber]|uniref:DUF1150 family protein n=1 Tax=Notoacmeibacter ruber TaxID=2670375 RepID=A0A3L7J849_9HYPH|nr:DUF1150 family protein [Notoacmeibacter ruber]RLQ86907.1 DUF1150 family protein [Notoacmeibacter ruber]
MTAMLDTQVSTEQFAHMGEGAIGYIRKISSDDFMAAWPGIAEMPSGIDIWALFAADGMPILLTDEKSTALAAAEEKELRAVTLQ